MISTSHTAPDTATEWALLERLARGDRLQSGDLAAAIKLQSRGLATLETSLEGAVTGAALTLAGEGLVRLRRAMLAP